MLLGPPYLCACRGTHPVDTRAHAPCPHTRTHAPLTHTHAHTHTQHSTVPHLADDGVVLGSVQDAREAGQLGATRHRLRELVARVPVSNFEFESGGFRVWTFEFRACDCSSSRVMLLAH